MASAKSKKNATRRVPAGSPSSVRLLKKPSRRVKHLYISSRLEISVRTFRTSKMRRSKRYKQWVIQPDVFGIREIAIIAKSRSKGRQRRNLSAAPAQRRWRPVTAAAIIVAGLVSSLYFGFHLQKPAHFDIRPPTSKVLAVSSRVSSKSMPRSVPTRLKIPKIGLDTSLSKVGLQPNGTMQMPWDIETAAWYKYSPTPGETGPSIIVGHLDGANYINMKGVFWRLRELQTGDEIKVSRMDGTTAIFKVISLKQVSQADFPTAQIYGNIKYAGLRLITCGGTFNSAKGHYSDNTVVFAALE